MNPVNIKEELNKLAGWAADWQLPISYSKCCILDLSNKPMQASLTFNVTSIPFVEEVVDLGIKMDKKFKFTSHVAVISCKGHR